MRVLVTRPEPAASTTAAALTALGHQALVAPLLHTRAQHWVPPETPPQALLVTSANAVLHGGAALRRYHTLPVFAVGAATASALRSADFADVRPVGPDVAATLAAAQAHGVTVLLYLAGANRTAAVPVAGLLVHVRTVYAARRVRALPAAALAALAAAQIDVVLLYSARSARCFAALAGRAAVERGKVHIAALSPTVAAAAGAGWARISIAAAPTQAALFAAAGLVCDKGTGVSGDTGLPGNKG